MVQFKKRKSDGQAFIVKQKGNVRAGLKPNTVVSFGMGNRKPTFNIRKIKGKGFVCRTETVRGIKIVRCRPL